MRYWGLCVVGALLVSGCGKTEWATTSAQPAEHAPAATAARMQTSGVLRAQFDTAVRAQDDFYRHINGTWLKNTPVPADQSNYGTFTKLADDAQEQLKAIIEAAAADDSASSDAQKVGDFYAAFMDQARANELGLAPLSAELARIDAARARDQLPALLAQLTQIGVNPFPVFIDADAKNASQYIVNFYQGGTGLPDRDFYLLDGEPYASLRTQYQAHIGKMLALAKIENAEQAAADIYAFEAALARAQWDKVDSRDADKTYNKYSLAELADEVPGFDWQAFLGAIGAAKTPGVVVYQPSFARAWAQQLQTADLATVRGWLKWQLISTYAPYLSQDFVDQNFAFYGTALNGIDALKPRWKRGVEATEEALGEVLGKLYVARHFPPAAKARMDEMVQNLIKAYEQSIRELDWMSDATRQKALVKLGQFTPKIGYPEKWRDYRALRIEADDLVGNVMRAQAFEHARNAAKLGQPIDRDEWFMTPQTINAYYNPTMNEIVFPAAILQPPFFDMNADDAVNYGAIGAVIGHEIGHGFDDQGSKYDGHGNLNSWWTDQDRQNFEARTRALIAQYDAFEPLPGHHVNGAFTVGENIGDLGGLSIALKAYHLAHPQGPALDGFSADQRVFIGWSQIWARNYKTENLIQRLKTDPHAPSEYRVNGIVRNIPAWYSAFEVKPGDALYLPPEQRVRIW